MMTPEEIKEAEQYWFVEIDERFVAPQHRGQHENNFRAYDCGMCRAHRELLEDWIRQARTRAELRNKK